MGDRVTLQTIADELGVSRTTVSNAYNRPDALGAELRARILAVADRLGYRGPDAAARGLRTGHRGAIGLLFTEDLRFVFEDADTTGFLQGVADASVQAGTGLMLLPSPPDLEGASTAVTSVAVDGHLVFSVAADDPALEAIVAMGLPLVIVDEPDLGARASFVHIDDRAGAKAAAEHLLALGHRRLAVLLGRTGRDGGSGPVDAAREAAWTIRIATERLAGYRDALTAAGLDPDELVVWEAGANDPDRARQATTELLAASPDVTGLLCFSDRVAIGACQGARLTGRRVPEDLSVVGFDDIPRAATWDPPLTTIRQPIVDKGRLAARLLLAAIDGAAPSRVQLPIEPIVRSSTAPPT
ncbi:MAG: LacI family DNA-binding transcriptional regulator [Actinomycetota bacterium]